MDGWIPRYAVIDIETTGFNPRTDEVVEVAVVQVDADAIVGHWASLVKPSISIPYRATEVHGICDRDVACAPSLQQVIPKIQQLRSEEHTSELQSRFDLVCRLLLE